MPESLSLTAALMLGLLSAGHCVGMCGGISSSLGVALPPDTPYLRRVAMLLSYNAGRIASYTLAGALFGLIGSGLLATGAVWMVPLRLLAGVMLLLMGLYIAGWWPMLARLEALGQLLWRRLQPLASRLLPPRTAAQALALGALWGWLPCGLVYSSLTWSAASGSWQQSALLMAAFGLGTLPTLLATGLLAEGTRALLQKLWFRRASGLLIMLLGVWTILGNMGHGGQHAQHSMSPDSMGAMPAAPPQGEAAPADNGTDKPAGHSHHQHHRM